MLVRELGLKVDGKARGGKVLREDLGSWEDCQQREND